VNFSVNGQLRRAVYAAFASSLAGLSANAFAQESGAAPAPVPAVQETAATIPVDALPVAPEPVAAKESTVRLERVQVTGSRVRRAEFTSSDPISSFGQKEITAAGTVSVDEFLKEIPSFTGYQQNSSTNNGSDGQKKVDLRGLGFNRTLILINGRRQIGDVNGDGAVDLNSIPEALIERVEVLKSGASTIYGSDALAGVINIILKKKFSGLELTANYGTGTDDGQATNTGFTALAGAASDRGNVLMSFGYSKQDEMLQAERPFATSSLYPLLTDGKFVATPSGSSNSRRIRVDVDGDGRNENRIVDAATLMARPFVPSDVYNFAPVNALITPNERYQVSAVGNLAFDHGVEAYFETLYTRRTSQQRLAPDASFAVRNDIQTPNNGLQFNDFVPASNPFNPYGVNPRNSEDVSNLDVRINRRFVESGGRLFSQGADTYRIVSGIQGELPLTLGNWDLSYTFAQNETVNSTKNYGRFDRWAIAVDPDACAADPDCTAAGGVLNPFDDYGSISQSQLRYISTGALKDLSTAQLRLLSLNLDGQFGDLPAGSIGWALGAERRNEKGNFSPDEFLASGLTSGGANDPQSGGFSATEFFGELVMPVLKELPGVHSLTVEVSGRVSDYDTVGSSSTFKVGADYRPIESVIVRAGYSTGFRAPNISELNQGDSTGFPIVDPICEFGDRRLAAGEISQVAYDNCQAVGADTTDNGEVGFAYQAAYTTSAPQTPLKPEESKSYNAGMVYNAEGLLKGLSLSADYFNITVDNVIGAEDINDLLRACFNSVGFASPACQAFPDGVPYADGLPADAQGKFGNLGTLKTSGWDFNSSYDGKLDLGAVSRYNLLVGATYLESYERQFPLAGSRELAGSANGFAVFPKWRLNAEVGVAGRNWNAAWQTRFIGATKDALRPAAITDDAKAEAAFYHDIVGRYTWKNVTFSGGVNNVLQEAPPRFHSAFNANTEPGTYDVIGRRLFLATKVSFK